MLTEHANRAEVWSAIAACGSCIAALLSLIGLRASLKQARRSADSAEALQIQASLPFLAFDEEVVGDYYKSEIRRFHIRNVGGAAASDVVYWSEAVESSYRVGSRWFSFFGKHYKNANIMLPRGESQRLDFESVALNRSMLFIVGYCDSQSRQHEMQILQIGDNTRDTYTDRQIKPWKPNVDFGDRIADWIRRVASLIRKIVDATGEFDDL